jgi:enoyl-CoA hydratase
MSTADAPTAAATSTELVLSEIRGNVGLITLNRPTVHNALSEALTTALRRVIDEFEAADVVGAMVLTGNEKAFAAGADIKEMRNRTFTDVYLSDFITGTWERIASCRKPIIAAVSGYALGGGCELALMCDFIIAAETARFGQPEITIGVLPGAGATQRLPRFVGKSKAMDMILTGRTIDAEEAERIGLVSRLVPAESLVEEAVATAQHIASFSRPAVLLAKECVNRAYETGMSEGIRFERRMFHASFATEGQKEGMAAFVEKRQPNYSNK